MQHKPHFEGNDREIDISLHLPADRLRNRKYFKEAICAAAWVIVAISAFFVVLIVLLVYCMYGWPQF